MSSFVLFVAISGIAGLFFLDRVKGLRNSKALWLPVVWLWIIGSRTPSMWLGTGSAVGQRLDVALEGNLTDALVFAVLEAVGIIVLLRRKSQTRGILKASGPIVIYFAYCLLSVVWSPFPDVALKRWIKATGDLVMVLIVVTDADPINALRRIYPRVGFILLPASIFMIRYTAMGRAFDPDGNSLNVGVTTNKNTLGLITFVLALGALWNLSGLLRNRQQPYWSRRLFAQGALLAFGLVVLGLAQSATSIVCFILGGGLMLVTGLRWVGRRPTRMHTVVLTIAIASGVGMVFGADEMLMRALGRNSNLTGRTEIWKTVIPMALNPVVGAGFESFWNASSARLSRFSGPQANMFGNLNSAHNGYIDVYLNLGWVGICLIAAILVSGYRRAGAAFRHDPDVGGLILAYIVTAAIYSITEAGFRILTPTWIFLLLAVVSAGGISKGYVRSQPTTRPSTAGSVNMASRWSAL